MYISEISAGMPVKLEVLMGATRLEFDTQSVLVEDKRQARSLETISKKLPYVVVEAIKKNDKVIGFPEKGAVYRVSYMDRESNKPYEWQGVAVKQVAFPSGEKYHVFISEKNMKEINRRESYRLWLGCDGYAQIGLNSKFFPAIIRDISATGIAFILYNKHLQKATYPPKISTTVVLTFTDDTSETQFKLTATIVRIEEMDADRTLYGSKFPQENVRIAKFINDKQRERNKTGAKRKDD
ncbi:MAG: PilZ domain-containing protein [Lachnospiraceae bacterium]|nr:PilZ domain-containing protein [Lachnospiraceae bacterium]